MLDSKLWYVTEDVEYTAIVCEEGKAPFRVLYYLQTEAGSDTYELSKEYSVLTSGPIGYGVIEQPKDIRGYVYDNDNPNNHQGGDITSDGSLVIALYYKVDTNNDGIAYDEQ